jgi:acetate kinase
MDDYALVINAGSSSLKFCVYRRPVAERWRLESRGQIEGIGTSPQLSVKDAQGAILADTSLGIGCPMDVPRLMRWHHFSARSTVARDC